MKIVEDPIQDLAKKLNFVVRQNNGCRTFGPRRDLLDRFRPEEGSEVFVAKLPPDGLEDEIFQFFSQVGPIFKIKLILKLNNTTKGYCFVQYMTPKIASKAVKLLNNTHFRPNHTIALELSTDHKKLIVSGINVTKETILKDIWAMQVEGLKSITPIDATTYLLEFTEHRQAMIAVKVLGLPSIKDKWGLYAVVDWAYNEQVVKRQERKSMHQRRMMLMSSGDWNAGSNIELPGLNAALDTSFYSDSGLSTGSGQLSGKSSNSGGDVSPPTNLLDPSTLMSGGNICREQQPLTYDLWRGRTVTSFLTEASGNSVQGAVSYPNEAGPDGKKSEKKYTCPPGFENVATGFQKNKDSDEDFSYFSSSTNPLSSHRSMERSSAENLYMLPRDEAPFRIQRELWSPGPLPMAQTSFPSPRNQGLLQHPATHDEYGWTRNNLNQNYQGGFSSYNSGAMPAADPASAVPSSDVGMTPNLLASSGNVLAASNFGDKFHYPVHPDEIHWTRNNSKQNYRGRFPSYNPGAMPAANSASAMPSSDVGMTPNLPGTSGNAFAPSKFVNKFHQNQDLPDETGWTRNNSKQNYHGRFPGYNPGAMPAADSASAIPSSDVGVTPNLPGTSENTFALSKLGDKFRQNQDFPVKKLGPVCNGQRGRDTEYCRGGNFDSGISAIKDEYNPALKAERSATILRQTTSPSSNNGPDKDPIKVKEELVGQILQLHMQTKNSRLIEEIIEDENEMRDLLDQLAKVSFKEGENKI